MTAAELKQLFVRRVEETMRAKAITRADLARLMGVRPSLVSRLLNESRDASTATLADVAKALGVDVCELLCETKKRKRP